jgi:mutual gliding-motility protein MglA
MHVDWLRREMVFKVIYYGPGLGGKTTNLEFIHAHLDPRLRGRLVTLKTRDERTLYFDFLELNIGRIRGRTPRFHLYTIPGQAQFHHSRRIVLRGADAIVFVADSQKTRQTENLASLMDLEQKLIQQKKTLGEFPWVIQYNKRDLSDLESTALLQNRLNFLQVPHFEAVAVQGIGVFETLRGVMQLLAQKI